MDPTGGAVLHRQADRQADRPTVYEFEEQVDGGMSLFTEGGRDATH